MTTSRAAIRNAVANLLEAGLGLPAGNVLRALPGKFYGMTPAVLVLSSGSGREPSGYGIEQPVFLLDIKTYVLLGKADDATWDSGDTEAQLDAIEAQIAGILEANATKHGLWTNAQYNGRSKVEDVMSIDGFIYRRESIPVRVECSNE